MTEQNGTGIDQLLADNTRIGAALQGAGREASLTHARLVRSMLESRDGEVVWIPPEEVFARYGLDANGKPRTG